MKNEKAFLKKLTYEELEDDSFYNKTDNYKNFQKVKTKKKPKEEDNNKKR